MERGQKIILFLKRYISKHHSISSNNCLFHRKFQNQMFSATQRHEGTLRDRSQYEKKAPYRVLPTLCHSGKGRNRETVRSSAVGRGEWGRGVNKWSPEDFRAVTRLCVTL